jgi:hypothetical protein
MHIFLQSLMFGCAVLLGLGDGLNTVSTFARTNEAVVEQGYVDDLDTYLMVSGKRMNMRNISTISKK